MKNLQTGVPASRATTLKHTLCAVALLGASISTAQATILNFEYSGVLTGGYDYQNQFGATTFGLAATSGTASSVGSFGSYADLTGQTATFRFSIDTDKFDPSTMAMSPGYAYYYRHTGVADFMTSSVTINGVTRAFAPPPPSLLSGAFEQSVVSLQDSESAGLDMLQLQHYWSYSAGTGQTDDPYHYMANYVDWSAYDYINSLINGADISQVNDYALPPLNDSTNNGLVASFAFYDYSYSYDLSYHLLNETAYGAVQLANFTYVPPTATDGPATGTVPEPASIALMGLGLAGLGATLRRRKTAQTN